MVLKTPRVNIDILIIKNNKILLGLLTKNWLYKGIQVYGVPGRDINFRERIGECVRRNIKEELDCTVISYKIISVNANYALGNHYIGIGIIAKINGNINLHKPIKSADWEKWEWFNINKVPNNLFPATKNLVECYLQKKVNISE